MIPQEQSKSRPAERAKQGPEEAAQRTRKRYRRRGYRDRWVDKRMGCVSVRHDLAGEWYRRGATGSDDFRTLTNLLIESAFGMDVETYRRYKGLRGAGEKLRDHMTDLELALTALSETIALSLHRARGTHGMEGLAADVRAAGQIAARTVADVESQTGQRVTAGSRFEPAYSSAPGAGAAA